jgi:hypothetical protein
MRNIPKKIPLPGYSERGPYSFYEKATVRFFPSIRQSSIGVEFKLQKTICFPLSLKAISNSGHCPLTFSKMLFWIRIWYARGRNRYLLNQEKSNRPLSQINLIGKISKKQKNQFIKYSTLFLPLLLDTAYT